MEIKISSLTRLLIGSIGVAFTLGCNNTAKSPTAVLHDSSAVWSMLPFVKADSVNPILTAGDNVFTCPILKKSVKWDEKDVFNPAAVVRNDSVIMLFRAEDTIGKFNGTSRLGLAVSTDGFHFTKMPQPVFYPDNDSLKVYEWEGGAEDPRIVEDDSGRYVLTYTAYDGDIARLMVATSADFVHWTKYGPALTGSYRNMWSKSGAIVCRRDESRMVATKIDGRFWMYYGDTNLFLATSDDLIHWTPVEENGEPLPVLKPRSGYFDSRLVESGPFALLTDNGIVLIYNSMNLDGEGRDAAIDAGAYCAGQALFDKSDPRQLVDRLEENFMMPDKPYELTGQVNRVCFLEGMVYFKQRWFVYYGTADSKIAVAVYDPTGAN